MVRIFIVLMLFFTHLNAEEIITGETKIEQLYHQLKYEEMERRIRFGKDTINSLLNKNKKIVSDSDVNTKSINIKSSSDSLSEQNRMNVNIASIKKEKEALASEDQDLKITKKIIEKNSKQNKTNLSKTQIVTKTNESNEKSAVIDRRSVVNHHYMPPSMRFSNDSGDLIDNVLSLGNNSIGEGSTRSGSGVSQSYSNNNYKKYGIKRNTWVAGRLIRTVTSADSTYIEIEIDDDIVGTRKILPAGTILFGDKSFNSQTRRLESRFNEAIDPDGNELDDIKASLFDMNKIAGLTGLVTRNNEESVNYSLYTGLSSVSDSVLQGLGGGNIGVDGLLTGGKTMLDLQKSKIKKPQAFITVSSRQVLIRIDKTF